MICKPDLEYRIGAYAYETDMDNNRNSVCDRIHFHEYMEECPDYVKEDENE